MILEKLGRPIHGKEKNSLILSEQDKCYIAGIIDGEGYVSINKRQYQKKNGICFSYVPVVTITNKSAKLKKYLLGLFKDFQCSWVKYNESSAWKIDFRGTHSCDLLKQIVDYLVIKKDLAEIILWFNDYRIKDAPHLGGPLQKSHSLEYDIQGRLTTALCKDLIALNYR